ncbi:DNA-processing protein DprA [Paracoccus sp. MBLB3053]|uniref:DNA-processing protein DprA n=1 Tax=Paracoccus aurantius TaxID=3073814 RepID=A0ABU2HSN1_9RHOB|nr:DNA-processing protein DprA [Paracoccus sp. MBLB3053]MDS9467619.1 DNA-processing protein DprA [Paracoccus sp. MBLB3053]
MARPRKTGPHHPRYPSCADSAVASLRLIRSRKVGPATFHRLLTAHGTVERAIAALPEIAREAGVADYFPCTVEAAEAEIEKGYRLGARLVCWGDDDYPTRLREIAEAPPVLWMRGNSRVLDRLPIAVIGARNASSLGLRMAHGLASALAEAGASVVAGLARGIDTAAHHATLAQGTIAIMAGGIDVIYPSENKGLAEAICETGLLVTEQPPGIEPISRHFPARNRIISGLSEAVVVIEAAQRSGSLITAKSALDQGREVMAVPGHPMDARASGCNALIRDGAVLIRNAEDVLAALSPDASNMGMRLGGGRIAPTQPEPCPDHGGSQAAARRATESPDAGTTALPATENADTNGPEAIEVRIIALLGPSPTEENMLIRDLGLPAALLAPVLLSLELSGRVRRLAGGRIALTD